MTAGQERPRMILAGKIAIVTGAGSGIGRAIASAFVRAGACVAFADLQEAAVRRAVADLGELGHNALGIVADATMPVDVQDMVDATTKHWGRIDILVNNVGGAIGGEGLDIDESAWDATISLCLKSQFLCCRAAAPGMREQRSGRIINIASNAGRYRSNTGVSSIAYSAAKGGVLQLTRSTAHALGPYGITVNAIAPGSVLSELGLRELEVMPERLGERVLRETPIGYFADPSEMASIAVFLASDDASYVTGATIMANGGWCTT
jgi:NAD(P)-dependent dehydrogenase (short-subunit alcohol dehydrogenase family)